MPFLSPNTAFVYVLLSKFQLSEFDFLVNLLLKKKRKPFMFHDTSDSNSIFGVSFHEQETLVNAKILFFFMNLIKIPLFLYISLGRGLRFFYSKGEV